MPGGETSESKHELSHQELVGSVGSSMSLSSNQSLLEPTFDISRVCNMEGQKNNRVPLKPNNQNRQ